MNEFEKELKKAQAMHARARQGTVELLKAMLLLESEILRTRAETDEIVNRIIPPPNPPSS